MPKQRIYAWNINATFMVKQKEEKVGIWKSSNEHNL